MTAKRFSPACERNQQPILDQLSRIMANGGTVLEIGSGTGQHAVFFGKHLPQVRWQTSDLVANHPSINAWLADAALSNVLAPMQLDVLQPAWHRQLEPAEFVFTANTAHIMSWQAVQSMIAGMPNCLSEQGMLLIYGPFNYGGSFTSDSNERFDASLRAEHPRMGIREFEAITALAQEAGLGLDNDLTMPANNRLLVFKRESGTV